jgi:hypothetical protein
MAEISKAMTVRGRGSRTFGIPNQLGSQSALGAQDYPEFIQKPVIGFVDRAIG